MSGAGAAVAVATSTAGTTDAGPALFEPLRLRDLEVGNRLWLSPMCQYSAVDGVPGDWHLAHLGDRASGGWGLVTAEGTAVSPDARITAADTGLWNDWQRDAWARVVDFVHARGTKIAVQLNHAGRKASIGVPWSDETGTVPRDRGGWPTLSAGAEAYPGFAPPRRADRADLAAVVADFAAAAARAVDAGFDAVEILAGHGFLVHTFLSPLTNDREDEYGGEAGRGRLLDEIVGAVRAAIPAGTPLFVRLSVTDWLPGGLDAAQSVAIAARLRDLGVDLVDASTGGLLPAPIPVEPGYQVPGAAEIRRATGIRTGAVGLITDPHAADRLIRDGQADVVSIGRAGLRDPYFARRAAHALSAPGAPWPSPYLRGAWDLPPSR